MTAAQSMTASAPILCMEGVDLGQESFLSLKLCVLPEQEFRGLRRARLDTLIRLFGAVSCPEQEVWHGSSKEIR